MSEELSALNRQAISAAKRHMGHFAWPTVLFTAATLVVFVGNLVLFAAGVMPLWAAIVVYAVATYFSYTPLHEAAHGNIHGQQAGLKWVNDLCGYAVAPLIMVPYSTHTVEHFTHHRYTNQPDKDPDYVVRTMGDGLVALIRTGLQFLWVLCCWRRQCLPFQQAIATRPENISFAQRGAVAPRMNPVQSHAAHKRSHPASLPPMTANKIV